MKKILSNIAWQLFVLFFIGFGVLSVPVWAQQNISIEQIREQDNPITLTQAINIAMANSTEIKRSLLNVQTANQQLRVAWSELLPDISGSADYTRNLELPVIFIPQDFSDPNSPLVPISTGTDNNWSGGITASQTLFKGEALLGVSSSQLYRTAQAENVRATSQQIVTQTRLVYYNVLIAEEQYRLQQASVERLRQNLEENRSRQQAGLVDEYDVLQVQVQLSNQEPQLTEAQYALEQAYRELKLTMGVPVELPITVQGDLGDYNILSEEASSDVNNNLKEVDQINPYTTQKDTSLIGVAEDNRGDIRVLQKQNELKDREILVIKSRFLPTLTASYNVRWQSNDADPIDFFGTSNQRVRTQSLMLNLSVPIFQGFERDANLQIAKIEKRDLELQQEYAIESAKNEIQAARESLDQAIETASARQQALTQAREGYRRAQVRLQNGLGSQLEVSDAEFQLRQAEVNYAQMVYNYLSAKARYDQAIGMVPFVDKSAPELD